MSAAPAAGNGKESVDPKSGRHRSQVEPPPWESPQWLEAVSQNPGLAPFFDNLESFVELPEGVEKLRDLFLRLAVQGQLVPVDDEDRALLARETVVGDYLTMQNGYAFKSQWFVKDGIRLVRNANIGHGALHWSDVARISEERAEEYERFRMIEGDIVLTLDRPLITTGLKVARVTQDDLPSLLLQRVARPVIKKDAGLVPEFFYTWLQSPFFIGSIDPGKSNGVPHISTREVQKIAFAPPTKVTQRRIVSKVESLMSLCDTLESQRRSRESVRERASRSVLASLASASASLPAGTSRATSRSTASGETLNSSWQRLSDHFEVLLDQPSGPAHLRQSILQLAVQGKLVPQDSNDEPASELIGRVLAQRNELIANNKVKKSKPLPALEADELPFDPPPGWGFERMGNLFRFIDYRGKTPKKVESGIRLITAKNIRMGFLKKDPEEFVTEETYHEWMTRGFPQVGDLLFTTEAPMGNVCLVALTEAFALAQRAINLHPYADQDSHFMMLAIMSRTVQHMIEELATGMTATGIKAAKLKLVPIPLPPLAEQKRIVSKVSVLLSQLDELSARLRCRQSTTDALLTALIHQVLAGTDEP